MNAETVESLTGKIRSLDDKIEAIRAERRAIVRRRELLLREPKTERSVRLRNSTHVPYEQIVSLKQKGWNSEKIRDHLSMLGTYKIERVWRLFRKYRENYDEMVRLSPKKISEKTC